MLPRALGRVAFLSCCLLVTGCSLGELGKIKDTAPIAAGGASAGSSSAGTAPLLDAGDDVSTGGSGRGPDVQPTCEDDFANGDETDVDCGGSCEDGCAAGQACRGDEDCADLPCIDSRCQSIDCQDGVRNGDETDDDCGGGSCGACDVGEGCVGSRDCTSRLCVNQVCEPPSCDDLVRNGDETDVDCGGGCDPCVDGAACGFDDDCESAVCNQDGRCASASCEDSVRNAGEVSVDCGGDTECPRCADGLACEGDDDCESGACLSDQCAASTCADEMLGGRETDTDCGGECPRCPDEAGCSMGDDCQSRVCEANVCVAATCSDGVKNGEEPSVDCGAVCDDQCADTLACGVAGDCQSGVCTGNTCAVPTCPDGVRNGQETDTDCGGPACGRCADGDRCVNGSDCVSRVCGDDDRCAEPECGDGVQNGNETDEDCGGSCDPCDPGDACVDGGDCTTDFCKDDTCSVPECDDEAHNGEETDLNCGGTQCPKCDDGLMCLVHGDCKSNNCDDDECQAATCSDGRKNTGPDGAESGVDCGVGTASCPLCPAGQGCVDSDDCISKVCTNDVCVAATCPDGVRNQDETAIDCGGPNCGTKCGAGLGCMVNSDCVSLVCGSVTNVCQQARCDDMVRNGDEGGTDCGGSCPTKCANGSSCNVGSDCASGVCEGPDGSRTCSVPDCEDSVQNGTETGIDCGDVSGCGGCPPGQPCDSVDDCADDLCAVSGRCEDCLTVPAGGLIVDFTNWNAGAWGAAGILRGSTGGYGAALTVTVNTTADTMRLTGNIGSFAGYGFYFLGPSCADASAFSGLRIRMGGSVTGTSSTNVQLQSIRNHPDGTCDGSWGSPCQNHEATISIPGSVGNVDVPWGQFSGGAPVSMLHRNEIMGLQLQFNCSGCNVDVTIERIGFY